MSSKLGTFFTTLALLVPLLSLRGAALYRRTSPLKKSQTLGRLPSLSIIVPARNEEKNLGRLLASLKKLEYPGELEIIVVDDHSTDDTAAIATALGAKLISAPPLPEGWLGKPHASHAGAQAAVGEWLLFTDADTQHEPRSAASAVAYAQSHGLDGLSLWLAQKTRGWLDQSTLMVAFAGLFGGLQKAAPLLNGQYVLIRKAAYCESGGFSAVRGEMIEDLALAHRLKACGFCVPMLRGEEMGKVFMYVGHAQLWRGMTRLGAGSLRWSGLSAAAAPLMVAGSLLPLFTPIFRIFSVLSRPQALTIWVSALFGLFPWRHLFQLHDSETPQRGVSTEFQFLLAPLGALFVQMAACWGLLTRLFGWRIHWKGRSI